MSLLDADPKQLNQHACDWVFTYHLFCLPSGPNVKSKESKRKEDLSKSRSPVGANPVSSSRFTVSPASDPHLVWRRMASWNPSEQNCSWNSQWINPNDQPFTQRLFFYRIRHLKDWDWRLDTFQVLPATGFSMTGVVALLPLLTSFVPSFLLLKALEKCCICLEKWSLELDGYAVGALLCTSFPSLFVVLLTRCAGNAVSFVSVINVKTEDANTLFISGICNAVSCSCRQQLKTEITCIQEFSFTFVQIS